MRPVPKLSGRTNILFVLTLLGSLIRTTPPLMKTKFRVIAKNYKLPVSFIRINVVGSNILLK